VSSTQVQHLKEAYAGDIITGQPLAAFTSFRLGGCAELFIEPAGADELSSVLKWVDRENVPVSILGGGSNVLISDKGLAGLVIRIGSAFNWIEVEDRIMRCGAAAMTMKAAQKARETGLTGMEFAVAIPGSVGGAIVMNAGTDKGEIGPLVSFLKAVRFNGDKTVLNKEDLEFAYRRSNIKGVIITEAVLMLEEEDKNSISERMSEGKRKRIDTQPAGWASAGCIFRNPPDEAAGRLIDQAGLKGKRVGGAIVSDVHANFIVLEDNACAADVRALIDIIKGEVSRKFNIELETEVRLMGDFT
jgi:UDP-N-acetylmuramate dehydrogenase